VFVATGDSARIGAYFAYTSSTPASTPFAFGNFGGMPLVVDATAAQAAAASNFNGAFVSGANKNLIKARIMTYAEQEFILAEAALKGYITTGTAQGYYNAGIMGAYAELGLDGTNYLTHANVAFDNSSAAASMNQIITQKWLANINNGFEGWIEYRRTGIPALKTGGSANLNNGAIPTRFLYPTSEQTINSTNYNKELQQMGGKEITTYKAWWEK
jgi:hypothetical protein